MSFSSSSSVLIQGVNITSLVLSAYLAKSGINVLLIDKSDRLTDEDDVLVLDSYSLDFLNVSGILLNQNTRLIDLFGQVKKVMLQNLCSIAWKSDIKNRDNLMEIILVDEHQKTYTHQTKKYINSRDLLAHSNPNINIKAIALLSWKLQYNLNGYIHEKIFLNHPKEISLLQEYTSHIPYSKIWQRIFAKKKQEFNLCESKINLHLSQERAVEAGDLLPNLSVYDERLKSGTTFYSWCNFGEVHLIILGSISQHNLFHIAKWIKFNFPVKLFYLPYSEKNGDIFSLFKVIEGEKKIILVRPDRYIGLIVDHLDLEVVDNYLSNFLHFQTKGKPTSQKLIGPDIIENYP